MFNSIKIRQVLFGLIVVGCSLYPFAAFAAGETPTTDIDELVTEASKLDNVMNAAVPTAVASIAFGAGAKVLKRVIYS